MLHYTAMANAGAAQVRLCDPASEVSSHYLISRTGDVTRLVPEDLRAWHAGAGQWGGRGDVNSRSIGIELDNDGASPFAEPQMQALEDLISAIMARWNIPAEGIIGHSDMAPERKSDPGPRFDWARLARAGLAQAAGNAEYAGQVSEQEFRRIAGAVGYPSDVEFADLLRAVRLRFRPWARGDLCRRDFGVLLPG